MAPHAARGFAAAADGTTRDSERSFVAGGFNPNAAKACVSSPATGFVAEAGATVTFDGRLGPLFLLEEPTVFTDWADEESAWLLDGPDPPDPPVSA